MSSLTSRLATMDRRVLAAVAAALVAALTAGTLGGVYAYQQAQPTTATLTPRDGEAEVPLDRPLTLRLSRPVSQREVAAHLRLQPAADGKLTGSPDNRTYTWTASAPWADLTAYTATLASFKDGAGHSVRGMRWRFTTTIVPRVTAVTNDSGSAVADGADQPTGVTLRLAFNAPMNKDLTRVIANDKPAAVTWSDDGRIATLPTKGMPVGPLALALGPGAADTAGHAATAAWKVALNLVFTISVHTSPLRYPAMVQVPNDPSARDQSGLQSAGMVFEYATEGGITRFTALFTSVPDKVGPVRSGRLVSIKLTRHYRGMLFLSGTSEGTFGVLFRDGVPTLFDTQGYYYRTTDRYPPNNLFISAEAIQRAEGQGAAFSPPTGRPNLSGGTPAASADVPEHRTSYPYDAATRTYLKTEDGHQFSDASIGQPLHIAAVVILHTRITTTGIIEDVNGARGLDFDIDGSGTAEIHYQGARYAARWSSPDRNSPLAFTTDQGAPITLPSGLVWVDLVS